MIDFLQIGRISGQRTLVVDHRGFVFSVVVDRVERESLSGVSRLWAENGEEVWCNAVDGSACNTTGRRSGDCLLRRPPRSLRDLRRREG